MSLVLIREHLCLSAHNTAPFCRTRITRGCCSASKCVSLSVCAAAQYDEEPGHEAFADDFQQAMTYFTKLSLTGGEVHSRGFVRSFVAEGRMRAYKLTERARCLNRDALICETCS